MGFDAISIAVPRDNSKKKRANKKLKQSKLDVRREQWLSQVKNKGCKVDSKVDSNGRGESQPSNLQIVNVQSDSPENLEIGSRGEENEGSSIPNSELESLTNSPIGSSLDHNDSRKVLTGSSSSSSGSTTSGCYSGSFSDEEEDDGCLDDWEAVADALTAEDNQHNPVSEATEKPETRLEFDNTDVPYNNPGVAFSSTESREVVPESRVNRKAWRPDDAFRPPTLPTPSKKHTYPRNPEWHCDRGAISWSWQKIVSQPSSCPICYEDLDVTDSSFLPCSCGFRLCLFCHKRILEADGRCPGCRKPYDRIKVDTCFIDGVTPCGVRSCSMSARS